MDFEEVTLPKQSPRKRGNLVSIDELIGKDLSSSDDSEKEELRELSEA